MNSKFNINKNGYLINNDNRYKIIHLINNEGSFGSIYKAIDLKKNNYVAIKQLKNINENIAFYNEISIMKQLKSLYSVKLLDKFIYENNFYIVMELYDKKIILIKKKD